jgi:hypothetical protein
MCSFVNETPPYTGQQRRHHLNESTLQKAVREARMEWLVVKLRGAYPNGETGFRGIAGYTVIGIYPQYVAAGRNTYNKWILAMADTPPPFAAYPDMQNCML